MIDTRMRLVALLALSPFALALWHAVLARVLRSAKSPQAVAMLASATGAPIAGAPVWLFALRHALTGGQVFWGVVYAALVYSGIAYCYFHLFNISETSRRLRILSEIWLKKEIEPKQLSINYHPEHQIKVRLERLVATRQLKVEEGFYVLDRTVLHRAALAIAAWGDFLRRPLGEP
ncbi:MAG: hypothetical protein HY078_03895 [Elusimicrobia bacterium]|nr:hypothetical protein [Elusimicrobiota bacterium]